VFSATAQPYTFSLWLKTSDGTTKTLRISISGAAASVVTVTGDWQRFSATWTASVGAWNPRIQAGLGATSATASFYAWGAQTEVGSTPSSPIETFGSTVTRAADAPRLLTSAFPHNAAAGTLFCKFRPQELTSGSRGGAMLSNNTAAECVGLFKTGNMMTAYDLIDNSVSQAGGASGQVAFTGSVIRAAVAYASNDAILCTNGTLGTQDTSATLPTVDRLLIGTIYDSASFHTDGWIEEVAYFPRRMSNAELQALTAA
jgi:hypothetical protein